jgi:hypothetical protein
MSSGSMSGNIYCFLFRHGPTSITYTLLLFSTLHSMLITQSRTLKTYLFCHLTSHHIVFFSYFYLNMSAIMSTARRRVLYIIEATWQCM